MRSCAAFFSLLLTIAFALAPGPAALAADPTPPIGLVMSAEAGIGGSIRESEWVPVLITLENQGEAISGEVVIDSGGAMLAGDRVSQPIELPHQSRKQITLYTRNLTTFTQAIRVQLLDSTGRPLAAVDAPVRVVAKTRLLIGVWSDDLALPNALAGVQTPAGAALITAITADQLPDDVMGWRALDCLVVARTDTAALTAAQDAALERWVALGGHLILVGGASPDGVMSGLARFSPVRVLRTEPVDLSPLADLAGAPLDAGIAEATAAVGQLIEGAEALSESGGLPLVGAREWGGGRVSFFAADPTLEPLASWQGMPLLWQAILAEMPPTPGWSFGFNSSNIYNATSAAGAIPGVGLPTIWPLLFFLLIYLIAIGPLNYLLVSRLKKRELSWFTIPIIVTAFSAAAYLVGFSLRGGEVIAHRLAVVHTHSGSDIAEVDGLLSVWSPRRRAYDITLEPGFLPQRLVDQSTLSLIGVDTPIDLSLNGAATLRDERIDASSLKTYTLQGSISGAPQIEGDLSIRYEDGRLYAEGEIVNYSAIDLDNTSLILLGQAVRLGDLPAGEVLAVDTFLQAIDYQQVTMRSGLLPYPLNPEQYYYIQPGLQNILAGNTCDYWDEEADRRRCDLTGAIFSSGDIDESAYLFGWTDASVYDVTIQDTPMKDIDLTLLIAEMRITYAQSITSGLEILSGEYIAWELEDKSASVYSPSAYGFYLEAGDEITYRYHPILPISEPFDAFTLIITQYDYSLAQPIVSVYNNETAAWVDVRLSPTGLVTVNGAPYFSEDGTVRVRFANPEGAEYAIEVGDIGISFHHSETE